MQQKEESKLIYERIAAVMQDLGAVDKEQINQQQRFKFRGIDDIYNAVHKTMAKHKVFTTHEILNREQREVKTKNGNLGFHYRIFYRFHFHTVDGSSVSTDVDGEGIDYGDKGYNKCLSIAHKYALISTFCIPTKEDSDPDKHSHQIAHPDVKKDGVVQMLTAFQKHNISKLELEEFLGHAITPDINKSTVSLLRGLFKQLKEGKTKEEVFKTRLNLTPNVNDLI